MAEITDATCFGDLWRVLAEQGATLQHARNLPRGWTVELRAPKKGIFEVTDQPSLTEALTACLAKVEAAPVRFRTVPPPPMKPIAEASFDELLTRSSLGTPGARAIMARANPETVKKCLQRADELDSRRHAATEAIDTKNIQDYDAKSKVLSSVFITHKRITGDFAISPDGVRSRCSSIRGESAGVYSDSWEGVTCKRCLRCRHG